MPRAAQTQEPSAHEDARANAKPAAAAGKKPVASKTIVTTAAPVAAKRPAPAVATKRPVPNKPVLVVRQESTKAAPATAGKKHARQEEEQVKVSKKKKEGSKQKKKQEPEEQQEEEEEQQEEEEADQEAGSEDELLEEEREAMEEEGGVARKKSHLTKVHLPDETVAAGVVRNIRKQERLSKRNPASALAPLAKAIKHNLKQHQQSRWYGSSFRVKPIPPLFEGRTPVTEEEKQAVKAEYRAYATGLQKARRIVEVRAQRAQSPGFFDAKSRAGIADPHAGRSLPADALLLCLGQGDQAREDHGQPPQEARQRQAQEPHAGPFDYLFDESA